MLIHKNIEIRDLGLYLVKEKVLVIGDIHIGYEEELNIKGLMIPRFNFKDLKERILKILDNVETVVINGDIKHKFGGIMNTEWKDVRDFLELFGERKIVLVQGNHDRILKPIVKDMELVDYYKVGDVMICHGDDIKDVESKVIIIGHEHCAIGLREGVRLEKYKCFIKGKYKRKVLIAMPSYNLLAEGSDVLREKKLSPYLQGNLDKFEVFVVSDKVYDFGKLKNLR
ncbi:phosphoesterase [archaeon]|jgi:uncharacterized protein|nr:phosphoesterase [archaeon]MBT3731347.1 phosphoesterase [archaeon]MBT4670350.1 phosphoesterase [archaeon]MBT5029632.1 phosphoesterase [archaeon]MBT5287619.1 phosphoesterase [archaeon]